MAALTVGVGTDSLHTAPDDLRTIHHVAGRQFFVTGAVVQG